MLARFLFLIVHFFTHTTDITPGCVCTQFDKDFDGIRYPEQIAHCRRNVTKKTRDFVASAYHINHDNFNKYEFDHLIPLAIGGSNNACNIWPQPLSEAHVKDEIELKVYHLLKKGKITQYNAIAEMLPW
jgi:hypothetical protein